MGPETNQTVTRRAVMAAGSIALVGTSGCASLMSRDIRDQQGDGGSYDEHDGSHGEDEESHGEDGESHGEDEGHDQGGGHTHHDHVEPIDHPVQHAEVGMVTNDGHHFEPHLVWIEVGGTVTWANESGSHTTTAYSGERDGTGGSARRIPEGVTGWDSELLQGEESVEVTFDAEGVYDYFCRPHEDAGMVGSVVVGEPDPHAQPGLEPPQEDIPTESAKTLEALNQATNEMLGHTHD